jgi:hypothetical protein
VIEGWIILLMMPMMLMMFPPGPPYTSCDVGYVYYHRHYQLYTRNPRQMGISHADDGRFGSSAHHQHHQQNYGETSSAEPLRFGIISKLGPNK